MGSLKRLWEGLLWLGCKLLDTKESDGLRGMLKASISLFLTLFVVLTFFISPFMIPTSSMQPGLWEGDFLIGKKFSYGYNPNSLFLSGTLRELGIINNSTPEREKQYFLNIPKRGEIIIFFGNDNKEYYIKRVFGLPGDRVIVKKGVVYINEVPLKISYQHRSELQMYNTTNNSPDIRGADIFTETFPKGEILDRARSESVDLEKVEYDETNTHTIAHILPMGEGYADNTDEFVVPKDCIFALGDNRSVSSDSRDLNGVVGFIPFSRLIAKPLLIYFSKDRSVGFLDFGAIGKAIRWNRIGTLIY